MTDEQTPAEAAPEPVEAPEAPAVVEAPADAPAPAEAPVEAPAPEPAPVVAQTPGDNARPRSDEDAVQGQFVDVVDGEHKGRRGAFLSVVEHDLEGDGFPKSILVRTRDELNELLTVAYEHVRPSKYTGGR